MAYTSTQLLDAFCRFYRYDTEKLTGETKVQFLNRIERKQSVGTALHQLRLESRSASDSTHETQAQGVSL
jgi:hypothetical protein